MKEFIAIICGQTAIAAWTLFVPDILKIPVFIFGIWCCLKLMEMARDSEGYEKDIGYVQRQRDRWLHEYQETVKINHELSEELSNAEEEIFELSQRCSELGEYCNDLKDILLENNIDVDAPQY